MTSLVDIFTLISIWLNILVGLSLFIFGIGGNCLIIYVFTRPIYRNTTSVIYLVAFSVASCIQIIHTLGPRILSDGFQVPIVKSNILYCQFRNIISSTASLCAISYPCWASFDQLILTSRNAATRLQWSSKRFAYRTIAATALFWFIVDLPLGIFTTAIGSVCTYSNSIVTIIYSYIIIPLVYGIIPTILFAYVNIRIVNNLRIAPIAIVSNTNKRMSKQVQRMLVPQLIVLILSGFPFAIQTVYATATAYTPKDATRVAIEPLIGHITRLLFYLNFVSAFYIYVVMSKEFRKVVKNLVYKQNIVSAHASVVVRAGPIGGVSGM